MNIFRRSRKAYKKASRQQYRTHLGTQKTEVNASSRREDVLWADRYTTGWFVHGKFPDETVKTSQLQCITHCVLEQTEKAMYAPDRRVWRRNRFLQVLPWCAFVFTA